MNVYRQLCVSFMLRNIDKHGHGYWIVLFSFVYLHKFDTAIITPSSVILEEGGFAYCRNY